MALIRPFTLDECVQLIILAQRIRPIDESAS